MRLVKKTNDFASGQMPQITWLNNFHPIPKSLYQFNRA